MSTRAAELRPIVGKGTMIAMLSVKMADVRSKLVCLNQFLMPKLMLTSASFEKRAVVVESFAKETYYLVC